MQSSQINVGRAHVQNSDTTPVVDHSLRRHCVMHCVVRKWLPVQNLLLIQQKYPRMNFLYLVGAAKLCDQAPKEAK